MLSTWSVKQRTNAEVKQIRLRIENRGFRQRFSVGNKQRNKSPLPERKREWPHKMRQTRNLVATTACPFSLPVIHVSRDGTGVGA